MATAILLRIRPFTIIYSLPAVGSLVFQTVATPVEPQLMTFFRRTCSSTSPVNVDDRKWYSLNTDGSVASGKRGAGGGVVRDPEGRLIQGFSCNLGSQCSVHVAELRALISGLKVTKEIRGVENLIAATDSEGVVRLVNESKVEKHPIREMIEECRELVRRWPGKCVVKHVRRGMNKCADKLAQHGHSLKEGEIEYLKKKKT